MDDHLYPRFAIVSRSQMASQFLLGRETKALLWHFPLQADSCFK